MKVSVTDMAAIGGRVRELRRRKGLTTVTLARKLRLSQGQTSRLETGLQPFRSAVLVRTARVLGVEPKDLLFGEKADQGWEMVRLGLAPSRVLQAAMRDRDFLRFLERCAKAARANKKNMARMAKAMAAGVR